MRRFRLGALVLIGVIAGTLIYGNLALIAASWGARVTTDLPSSPDIQGIRHLEVVDERVWRGGHPDGNAYHVLAARGVTTVVDLRPDPPSRAERARVSAAGMELVHIPIVDGRYPSATQLRRFTRLVDDNRGRVFVHCSEGVGRTGTMSAAYAVTTGQTSSIDAVRDSLAVGVLTLEQIAFISSLERDRIHKPPAVVSALSRFLDGPRQLFNALV
jgi:protein-tyrosine phosphatase